MLSELSLKPEIQQLIKSDWIKYSITLASLKAIIMMYKWTN